MLSMSLGYFYRFIYFLLFARAIMSWISRDYNNPIVRFVYEITEPILYPMRALFERNGWNRGMFDFSFLATLLVLEILFKYLIVILYRMGL